MTDSTSLTEAPWELLHDLIDRSDSAGAKDLIDQLGADEQRRLFSRLELEERQALLTLLGPEDAAALLEHLVPQQAVEVLEELAPDYSADVMEELSDERSAELLREMDREESSAILDEFDDVEDSEAFRRRLDCESGSAGGLMVEMYHSFQASETIGAVLRSFGKEDDDFGDLEIQYAYAVDADGRLIGVLPVRDLVRTPPRARVNEVMIANPLSVTLDTPLQELRRIFDEKSFLGLPVVDADGRLCGVVSRSAVRRATTSEQTDAFLKLSGIIGGEELRSMPFWSRCFRRLAWLGPNILLNLLAASVIASFEGTLQAVIALAVFLPIVSDMSGCAGNQAVAVSIRELTLGVIKPLDFLRVAFKEGSVGIVNGIILGILLGIAAFLWKDNVYLGMVVAAALGLNTVFSVLLGGLVPLGLKRFGIDPALASGPILTTCTDMCGFFLVLSFATVALAHL
ncbi:magnesium transporter [Haloferula sp. A504]|uniref:magnesium transporter n=1 Tax=Haloferula sp. A504 TaxID=3373601 RepID=UPI0031CB253F|nr:magnesium transporter [Verrucomicrobiaceae bacterium E54]